MMISSTTSQRLFGGVSEAIAFTAKKDTKSGEKILNICGLSSYT
jgi:hypothetical protein